PVGWRRWRTEAPSAPTSRPAAHAELAPAARARTRSGGLRRARSRYQPYDEAQHRQEENQQRPQHLAPGRGPAAEHVDQRPDVGDQDQKTEEASDFDSHGAALLLPAVQGRDDNGPPRR